MKRLKHVLTAMLMLWLAAGCKDAASSQQQQQEDARQHLETLIQPYLDQMQQIEHVIYSDTVLGREAEWELAKEYKQLADEMGNILKEQARENIGNEMGFLLVTQYLDPIDDAKLLDALIPQMPDDIRQREEVAAIEQQLEAGKAIEVGRIMADIVMNTPEGEPLSVMEEVKKNKMTIIHFWASWCGACRNEMALLRQLYAEHQPEGLGMVGISIDESAADWNRAIGELKLAWPQISDLKGWECDAARRFQIRSLPFIIVVDSNGRIVQKGLPAEELKQFIGRQLP